MTRAKVLHGPIKDGWAVKVDLGDGRWGKLCAWHRCDDEEDAMEKAREELAFWKEDDAVFDRVDPPLRVPLNGGGDEDEQGHLTDGCYSDESAEVPFSGACPVQGEGEVDGYQVYYRARGTGWTLTLSLSDNEDWTYGEAPYAWPDGGWIHRDESKSNIATAVTAFRARFGPKEAE